MLNNEKKRAKGPIDPFNASDDGHRGLEMEDDGEATCGLNRRGSKLQVVEHPSQGEKKS
jgi:hypothetical protein